MNKRSWIIPILIVAINALAIAVRWAHLPELLPALIDFGDAYIRKDAGVHARRAGNPAGYYRRFCHLLY